MELSAAAEAPGTYIEAVQQRLREDIVSGRLAPREKLRLAELKTRYAMGSSPLREALSRLVGEGLVTFEGNRDFGYATCHERIWRTSRICAPP